MSGTSHFSAPFPPTPPPPSRSLFSLPRARASANFHAAAVRNRADYAHYCSRPCDTRLRALAQTQGIKEALRRAPRHSPSLTQQAPMIQREKTGSTRRPPPRRRRPARLGGRSLGRSRSPSRAMIGSGWRRSSLESSASGSARSGGPARHHSPRASCRLSSAARTYRGPSHCPYSARTDTLPGRGRLGFLACSLATARTRAAGALSPARRRSRADQSHGQQQGASRLLTRATNSRIARGPAAPASAGRS